MPIQLYPGTLANFNDSMAQSIENAMAGLGVPMPSQPPQAVIDRRVLFIAIAEGVIRYLKQKESAFEIKAEVNSDPGEPDIDTHPDIQVRFL